MGPVATLPPQKSLILPREKVIPEPKPETRWEKFAKDKGIEDKKRSRMIWDDIEQKWAPRFGYKRAYDDTSIPIMEVKPHENPFEDPWERKRAEKQARVAKNTVQRERNEERSDRRVNGIKSGIPVDLPGSSKPMQKGKDGVRQALSLAQHSTASMGKFDVKRVGEPTMHKQKGTRREKVSNDNTASGLSAEKERSAKIIKHVIAVAERPMKPNVKGDRGLRIEARKRSREFHPLDDTPFENLGGGDAGEFRKKKGRAAGGKMTKITKKRAK
jgi:regulator of ribosome biosynthesis